jgi:lipooligosaccharide transport system permease protein
MSETRTEATTGAGGGQLTAGPPVRTPALRLDAVAALVLREWWSFRRTWFAPTFGSVLEPLLYLVAFGYGFGALVADVAGIPYLDFMATGAAAIAVLFTSMSAGLLNAFFRRTTTHLYDGLLGTPIRARELVTAEATWIGMRTAGVAVVTLAVAVLFGVRIAPTVVAVPVIGWLGGFAFGCLFAAIAARLRSMNQIPFVISLVFLPIFLVSWAIFPLNDAPAWLRVPAYVNPMSHLVVLLRGAALGVGTTAQLLTSAGALLLTTVLSWLVAVRSLGESLTS